MLDPAAPPAPLDVDALISQIADRVIHVVRQELASAPPSAPPLLDLSGVAQRLGVSERTVETLVAMGELPFSRIGARGRGARRFEPEAVEAFIRRRAGRTGK
ncbi:MAG TPA: helix-turn-helix domain-containing protein [Rubricoccaceae bacterium]|jgi:excisionase family DNA binding protein